MQEYLPLLIVPYLIQIALVIILTCLEDENFRTKKAVLKALIPFIWLIQVIKRIILTFKNLK